MDLCCSPGYRGPGTFYGIEKSWPPGEIWLVQNGTHVCDFVNFTIFVWKTGFKKRDLLTVFVSTFSVLRPKTCFFWLWVAQYSTKIARKRIFDFFTFFRIFGSFYPEISRKPNFFTIK